MARDWGKAGAYIAALLRQRNADAMRLQLSPRTDAMPAALPLHPNATPELVDKRWSMLQASADVRAALADEASLADMHVYDRHIENLLGTVKVPVALAGPLRINGLFAHGDYYVPVATTEAALVAGLTRGASVITESGGCTTMLLSEGVSRAPGFVFASLQDAGGFVAWAVTQEVAFAEVAARTTQHGSLQSMLVTVEGNHVYLTFEYLTGDAAGQNMVTFATSAICDYIREHAPVRPREIWIEANLSGDKKASAQSFMSVRGRKVTAEVLVPKDVVKRRFRTTPQRIAEFWRMSAIGGALSGTIGLQAHVANALAAIYLACGQDVASISESAVGVTRLEVGEEGGLYAAVTLPNVIVGTVGGGTALPSQQACLRILGLAGEGHARALAEVCCALALAGEISITASVAAGDFVRAHRHLARAPDRKARDS